jgi:hypothetical protein
MFAIQMATSFALFSDHNRIVNIKAGMLRKRWVDMDKERKLSELIDKEDIREAQARYARGVDRCDIEMVRAAYHDDAYDDHGAYKGGVPGLLDWIESRHVNIDQSLHMLGNSLIDFQSDTSAVVETPCVTFQRYDGRARDTIKLWVGDVQLNPGEYVYATMACRFVDLMEKREGKWRIFRRTVVFEEIKAVKAQSLLNDSWALARRDSSDPLWKTLAATAGGIRPDHTKD